MLKKRCLVLLATIIGSCFSIIGQTSENFKKESANLIGLIKNYHVAPPQIDDVFSGYMFEEFVQKLDPDAIFFTKEDIGKIEKYKYKIDDELMANSSGFLTETAVIYEKCLKRTDSIFYSVLTKPMDFSKPESFETDTCIPKQFYESGNKHRTYVGKWLKKQVLLQMIVPNYGVDSANNSNPFRLVPEEEARSRTLKRQQREIKSILDYPGGIQFYLSSLFLGCLAKCADPHTEYMSEKETRIFKEALSSENLSFGMQVDENNQGEIEIIKLAPGGPAWKSNELNEGDIILKIQWLGEQIQDLYGMNLYEADEVLRQPDRKQMAVTVRKKDGSIKTVWLIKAKITQEDNIVRGYILSGANKIGYISLPAFYTSFENQSSLGCSNDVAKEIIKLQKDKIQGLILDLRFNGGGSLSEAIDLTGIFFDYGPVGITRDQEGNQTVLKDVNKGSIYNGPLVVLINGQSASSSEIVAAALQDYNRAVIVGNTTFGKATSQVILPNDTSYAMKESSISPKQKTGYLKLTTNRLYRVNGKSVQQRGVIPDIYVPDMYNAVSDKESSYSHALSPDSILRSPIYKPLKQLPISELGKKSIQRQSTNKQFLELNQNIEKLSDFFQTKNRSIPLDLTGYQNEVTRIVNLFNTLETLSKSTTEVFKVGISNFDDSMINFEPETKKIYEHYYVNIKDDLYIQEAFHILSDLIEINKTSK